MTDSNSFSNKNLELAKLLGTLTGLLFIASGIFFNSASALFREELNLIKFQTDFNAKYKDEAFVADSFITSLSKERRLESGLGMLFLIIGVILGSISFIFGIKGYIILK